MRQIEAQLEVLFSSYFRRIWITYSPLNTLQVIVFPIDRNGQYRILTQRNVQLWQREKNEQGEEIKVFNRACVERLICSEFNLAHSTNM